MKAKTGVSLGISGPAVRHGRQRHWRVHELCGHLLYPGIGFPGRAAGLLRPAHIHLPACHLLYRAGGAKLMGRFRYKRLLLCGVTVAVLSTAAMAFSRELWLFYLTGLLRGLGVGLFSMVPITIILTNWFHKSHGVATSITLSFSGLARGCMLPPVHPVCHGIGVGERLPCHGGGNSAFYPARPAGSIHRRPPPNGGCAPMATTASRRTTAAPQPRSAIKTPPFSACA